MSTDLAVIEAALKTATPGPWETWPHAHIEDDCRCLSCQFVTVWQTHNSLDCEDVPKKPGESERCEASGYSWEDANLIANAPTWLAELVERVKVAEAEVERVREAARTLGKIIDDQCRDVLDITGAHDLVDADGDGDWGAIWDLLREQAQRGQRAEAAEAAIERVRSEVLTKERDRRAELWRERNALAERCSELDTEVHLMRARIRRLEGGPDA